MQQPNQLGQPPVPYYNLPPGLNYPPHMMHHMTQPAPPDGKHT